MLNEHIGRLLRSATSGFVFGCRIPEADVPCFGDFVKAPAQRGRSTVIGLVYDLVIQDDAFVRPLVATPDLSDEYVLDQRENRHVPIEVSVLAVGYREPAGYVHSLPPQPPLTLDSIDLCAPEEIRVFTERLDFLRLIVESVEAPADELAAAAVRRAAGAQPPQDRAAFLHRAGRELARLLPRDLPRLNRVLQRLRA
ncbi:MAG: hypothetical protein KA764_15140 [Anaerolineales bacterium]|nr:hypothetical protein [Anaerolineales bacterium]